MWDKQFMYKEPQKNSDTLCSTGGNNLNYILTILLHGTLHKSMLHIKNGINHRFMQTFTSMLLKKIHSFLYFTISLLLLIIITNSVKFLNESSVLMLNCLCKLNYK